MGFEIFFKSVTEPVQAGLFIAVIMAAVFALGYWAGGRRTKVNHWHVSEGTFNLIGNTTLQKASENDE